MADPVGGDYHWYKLNADGTWSHKPGNTPVTNKTLTLAQYSYCKVVGGNIVTDPILTIENLTYDETKNISDPRIETRKVTSEFYAALIGFSIKLGTQITNYTQYVGIFIVD